MCFQSIQWPCDNDILATSDPQRNIADPEWEEPNFYNGIHREVPSGSENDNDDVSTNYPPESFLNQSETSVLKNPMNFDVNNV